MEKKELISQTKLAFEFIQKLYLEVSYLIKEVEGLLAQEEEEFIIGRPSGYAVATRNSAGLDPINVNLWLYRKLSVFFVPKSSTKTFKGQTITHLGEKHKILYLRAVLDDKNIREPIIYFGVLQNFEKKRKGWPEKIEQVMAHIEYNETKVFDGGKDIDYEDAYITFKGNLVSANLYDINSSQEIAEKLIMPGLNIFRGVE